jgi:hypothetical protein
MIQDVPALVDLAALDRRRPGLPTSRYSHSLKCNACEAALLLSNGDAGEGTIVGPGMVNIDLSFFKNIKFTESKLLQFRWEMFNAFNHVNLGNPVTDVTSPQFGVISSAAAARIMQAGLKFYF